MFSLPYASTKRDKLFKMAQKMQNYDEMSTTELSNEYHRTAKVMCCVLLTSNAIKVLKGKDSSW